MSLGTGGASLQNALIGCSFIDNPTCMKGKLQRWRIVGCSFIDSPIGISNVLLSNIINACEFNNLGIAINFDDDSTPSRNVITGCTFSDNDEDIIIRGDNHSVLSNNFSKTVKVPIKTADGYHMGLNIQGNIFHDASEEGLNLYPCIQINSGLHASTISNNIFRNSATGKASHGVWFEPEYIVGNEVTDTLVIGNIARNMQTAGYIIKTGVTQANNIGTVETV